MTKEARNKLFVSCFRRLATPTVATATLQASETTTTSQSPTPTTCLAGSSARLGDIHATTPTTRQATAPRQLLTQAPQYAILMTAMEDWCLRF